MSDDFIITVRDAVRAGYCTPGFLDWADSHGFNRKELLKNGIEASKLRELGDGYGLDVLAKVEARRAEKE